MKDYKLPDIELVSKLVHDAWWKEKKKQGFHAPLDCPSENHLQYLNSKKSGGNWDRSIDEKKFKWCSFCHPNMYPYAELSEQEKELDRTTVRTVYEAIKEAGI